MVPDEATSTAGSPPAPAPPAARTRGEGAYRALCALALAVVLGVFFHETLFGDRVLTQADHMLSYPPWAEVAPEGWRSGNPLLEDQAIAMVPWLAWAADELRSSGELPLWNPYNFGGQPIHAANSGAFLYPLNLAYFAFPSLRFYAWSAFLRLLVAGLGMVLFLRSLGVSRAASLPGAMGFMLSGFLVAWLNHPHVNVAALMPLLLWSVERIARRPRWREAGLAGILFGAQLLGGHVQTSLQMTLVLGAWCLFRTWVSLGGTQLGTAAWRVLVVGALLGGLLSAPQTVPFLEYARGSQGEVVLETLEQSDRVASLEAMKVMVAPNVHGRPHWHDYDGPSGRNLNYNEIIGGYVGRLVLVLAAAAVILRLRDARTRFFLGLAAFCALVAWQVWPIHDLVRQVPKLRSTNPMRVLLFVSLGLSVLGALGLDALFQRLRLRGGHAATVGLGCFVVIALELVTWGRGHNPAIDPALAYPENPVTEYLGAQEGVFRAQGVQATTLRANANLAHRIATLSGYDKIEFPPMVDLALLLTEQETVGPFLSEIPAFDRPEALPLASLLGIRFFLALEELPPPLELEYTSPGGVRVYENPQVLPRAFAARDLLVLPERGARLAHFADPALDPWTAVLASQPRDDLARRGLAAADGTVPGTVRITSYTPREVRLEATLERPGLVVVADAWDEGWVAEVAGEARPVERVDHALRGVWVDAGRSEVVLRYEPGSVTLGLVLGALGGLLTLVLVARGGRDLSATARTADPFPSP